MKIISFVLCVMLVLGGNAYGGEGEKCQSDSLRKFFGPIRTKNRADGWVGAAPRRNTMRKNPNFTGIQISAPGTGNILPQAVGQSEIPYLIPDEIPWFCGLPRLEEHPGWCAAHFSFWHNGERWHLICSLDRGHRGDHHGATEPCRENDTKE